MWTFGDNSSGQLGLGNIGETYTPTKIENFKVKQISCGTVHTAMIDLNNNVFVFGSNFYAQLGLGDDIDRNKPTQIPTLKGKAKQISAGNNHTAVIDLENNIGTFGYNKYGQLGLGNIMGTVQPTQISNFKAEQIPCGFRYSIMIATIVV